ncbi:hypothetical protein [Actinomadura sp. KC06]|uniref:hypothetical protein n=1 Tax=Actinomadura sp. KC06 TaxID=2530369 RepID=UPI001A9FC155|nr:hypothetical protein [Actinomadura sp. KC06]
MDSEPPMGSDAVQDEIRLYLRARVALIVLVTVEERRALQMLDRVRRDRDPSADLITWDVASGLESAEGRQLPKAVSPPDVLAKIQDLAVKEPARRDLYVLKDFHAFWERDPVVRRRLRNLADKLVYTGSSLIVTTPLRAVPVELGDDAVVVEMPLPDGEALRRELDHLIDNTKGVKCTLTPAGRGRLAQAALGLTAARARQAFAKAIVRDDVLDDRDIDAVVAEKKAVIRESEALEFYTAEESPDDLGGLGVLKECCGCASAPSATRPASSGCPRRRGSR